MHDVCVCVCAFKVQSFGVLQKLFKCFVRLDALTVKMETRRFCGLRIFSRSSVKVCLVVTRGFVLMPPPPPLPCRTDDPLGLTAAADYELAVSALGACVWYFQRCFVDKDLLSMKSFQVGILFSIKYVLC